MKVEGCHQLICISAINVLSNWGKTIALKMNIQVSKGKCGILIMKETGEMAAHMRFHNLWIQIKYPLADQLMNFFSQQSKNTNDFFYCDSWSKELFRECFMKFRNFSCSAKLLPGFLKVAVDISCFILFYQRLWLLGGLTVCLLLWTWLLCFL